LFLAVEIENPKDTAAHPRRKEAVGSEKSLAYWQGVPSLPKYLGSFIYFQLSEVATAISRNLHITQPFKSHT
jgi:hypothetical protein